MPPKRKLKVDDTNDSIRSFCEDRILDGHVQHSLEMFGFLPTDAILTQVVGICTRVSTMIASLLPDVSRCDAVDNIQSAFNSLSMAVIDLIALEHILFHHLSELQSIDGAGCRRSRRCTRQ
jgi:hypothetical protein